MNCPSTNLEFLRLGVEHARFVHTSKELQKSLAPRTASCAPKVEADQPADTTGSGCRRVNQRMPLVRFGNTRCFAGLRGRANPCPLSLSRPLGAAWNETCTLKCPRWRLLGYCLDAFVSRTFWLAAILFGAAPPCRSGRALSRRLAPLDRAAKASHPVRVTITPPVF
jgi:hypothetical protein